MIARPYALLSLCCTWPHKMALGEAVELVRMLGELARWWVHPDLLARAARALQTSWPQPQLPTSRGSCWIVFAQDSPTCWPALRESFLLPLQWRENTPDSPRLPEKLGRLARDVARTVHLPHWGLHLSSDVGLDTTDLSDFNSHFQVESAWAAIAGGLLLAAEGGTPDPAVWASGGWNPNGGVANVGHLEPKLRLALEWGAREFFLPATQIKDAAAHLGTADTLQLHPLKTGTCDPKLALADYLARLDAPPPPPPTPEDQLGFARCAAYFLRQPLHVASTQAYYRGALLPHIIDRLKRHVQTTSPTWRPSLLVTIVSGSEVLVELMARVLNVSQVLLLHTPDSAHVDRTKQVQARLAEAQISCRAWRIRKDEGMLSDVTEGLRSFDIPASQMVFDLTPGTKLMTYALARVAPAGSWLVYLEHDYKHGRPQPGSERLLRWQAAG